MEIRQIYTDLATQKSSLSNALALTQAFVPLTEEECKWVSSELQGYKGKENIPEYRQLPCVVKVRVQNQYSGAIQETKLIGQPMEELDNLLKEKFGLSVFKMYVSQGVESIEMQVNGHRDGDIIMAFEGRPAEELKNSIRENAARYYCIPTDAFQSSNIAYLQNTLLMIKARLMLILKEHMNQQNVAQSDNSQKKEKKVVFISYCWESEEHKDWVHKLADDLREMFEVKIDVEMPFGVELSKFMEDAVSKSDKVLIITTPEYKHRADNRIRGVGYETSLITDDLVNDQNRIKFIPIIRKGTKELSYPKYLGTRKGADMTDDEKYGEVLEDLKCNLVNY